MRKPGALYVLGIAAALTRPSLAACPGTSACVYNLGCPPSSPLVVAGQSIQAAINAAPCTPSTLCVDPGIYTELIDFQGKPIYLVSTQGPAFTVLDGGGAGPVVTFSSGEGSDSTLDGFTIRNGNASYGAGIFIKEASPSIRNSILINNAATGGSGRGGGIGVLGAQASPFIACTEFLGNTADFAGGGLASTYSAAPYLRSNLFKGNSAPYGGGIAVHWSGRIDLGWTELDTNQAKVDGGGMHVGVPYGNALVRQTWFHGNAAANYGGGMWVPAGLAEVVNCTFDSNQASQGGGIAAGYGGMVSVASTIFVKNTSNGGSATLINAQGFNTSVVNHYNVFFSNTGPAFANTYGNTGLVLADPLVNPCCPGPGSPAIDAGIPDIHFNDPGSPNDIGACGGPALLTYGPMQ